MKSFSIVIVKRLKEAGKTEKAAWLERYVKHDIKSLGVGIPEIREIVRHAANEFQLTHQSVPVQTEALNVLMEQAYTGSKLADILYLQLFWKEADGRTILDLVSEWFDKEWISDWNVCDWLCVRLLTPLLDKEPGLAVPEFSLLIIFSKHTEKRKAYELLIRHSWKEFGKDFLIMAKNANQTVLPVWIRKKVTLSKLYGSG